MACEGEEIYDVPLGAYDNGILVLNEGDQNSGSITYVSNGLANVQQDIFTVVNGTQESIGGYVQSMFFEGYRAFIISNLSNKINVVNRYTFEYLETISTGLSNPRYGVISNGKAYVTNMADFNTSADDYISVINLGDLSVEAPIPVGDYAERLIVENGKLYVSNGAFGMGDQVTIINAQTKTIVGTIEVGVAPNSLEVSNGVLYILASGFGAESKIVRVNVSTNAIIDEVVFPATMPNALNLDVDGNHFYFTSGPKIYKVNINSSSVSDAALIDTASTSPYIGYGFAVRNERIYIAEAAADFSSDGRIFVYNTSGTLVDEIPVGLGPNGIYFNE